MDLQLTGKRALVTGSSAGIGFAIAHRLSMEGAEVVVNSRSQDRADKAASKIKADTGGTVAAVAADLSTADGCESFAQAAGDCDILVNNVGIFEPIPFPEIDDAKWLEIFNANVMSGVRLGRHYLPKLLSAGWGRIVFISSESALQIPEEMVHYGMTKSAQIAVARGMAEATKGTKVTVNSVLPGPTSSEGVTEFVENMMGDGKSFEQAEQQFFTEARPSSLLQRFAEPAEVANLVAYVCSPLASATNGAALRVEGGVVKSAF